MDILIEAISKIKDDTGWSYVIAGSGISSEQKELGRLLKQYGLQDRVSVIGRVAGKDKKRFFEETAIFVVPSRFETFSLVALEALAYGLPIVAFEITGLSWLPRKGVSWVRPSDAHMLARKIQTLQHDSKSRISMSKINTQASKSYAWETVLTLYRSLIREII